MSDLGEMLLLELLALENISTGQEITISYLTQKELQLLVQKRRQILLERWHFLCKCQRCTTESY